jgi:hypothetical protein
MIGLPWALLQSVAWTTMLIEYSQQTTLRQAIEQTFDGAHPCNMCKGISAAQHSPKRSPIEITTPKLDLICTTRSISFSRRFEFVHFIATNAFLHERKESPPVPPPRFALS